VTKKKMIMIRQPKKWWFALLLPAALFISYVIWVVRSFNDLKGLDDLLSWTGDILFIGLPNFPLGLFGSLWLRSDLLSIHRVLFVVCGYLLYIALMAWGLLRPSWRILLLFAILLAMNIVGCQMDHTLQAIIRV
jgi:hypothetical protein